MMGTWKSIKAKLHLNFLKRTTSKYFGQVKKDGYKKFLITHIYDDHNGDSKFGEFGINMHDQGNGSH